MPKKLGESFRPVRSCYSPPLSLLTSSCPACHGDRDPSQRSARTEALKLRQELGGAPPTARPDPELDRILADKNDPNAGGDPGAGTGVAVGGYGGMPASAKSES